MITREQIDNLKSISINSLTELLIKDLPGSEGNEKLQNYVRDLFAELETSKKNEDGTIDPFAASTEADTKAEYDMLTRLMKGLQFIYPEEAQAIVTIIKDNDGHDPGVITIFAMAIRAMVNIYAG